MIVPSCAICRQYLNGQKAIGRYLNPCKTKTWKEVRHEYARLSWSKVTSLNEASRATSRVAKKNRALVKQLVTGNTLQDSDNQSSTLVSHQGKDIVPCDPPTNTGECMLEENDSLLKDTVSLPLMSQHAQRDEISGTCNFNPRLLQECFSKGSLFGKDVCNFNDADTKLKNVCCHVAQGTNFPRHVEYPKLCNALCQTTTPQDVLEMVKSVKRELSGLVARCSPTGKAQGVSISDLVFVVECFGVEDDVPQRVHFAAVLSALGRYHRWDASQNISLLKVIHGAVNSPFTNLIVEHIEEEHHLPLKELIEPFAVSRFGALLVLNEDDFVSKLVSFGDDSFAKSIVIRTLTYDVLRGGMTKLKITGIDRKITPVRVVRGAIKERRPQNHDPDDFLDFSADTIAHDKKNKKRNGPGPSCGRTPKSAPATLSALGAGIVEEDFVKDFGMDFLVQLSMGMDDDEVLDEIVQQGENAIVEEMQAYAEFEEYMSAAAKNEVEGGCGGGGGGGQGGGGGGGGDDIAKSTLAELNLIEVSRFILQKMMIMVMAMMVMRMMMMMTTVMMLSTTTMMMMVMTMMMVIMLMKMATMKLVTRIMMMVMMMTTMMMLMMMRRPTTIRCCDDDEDGYGYGVWCMVNVMMMSMLA